jgi:hypothetical protein
MLYMDRLKCSQGSPADGDDASAASARGVEAAVAKRA